MTKLSKPQVKIVNVETGEEIVRDATAEEIAQMQVNATTYENMKAAEAEKAVAKQAILDRLGLTADEAKLLLG
jgi:hypothetical protein